MTPPVSIALCTYNGEAYLATQHDSILAQHSLPEEIKLSDDGTTGRRVDGRHDRPAQAVP